LDRGQQNGHHDANDCDDDQQLDERERKPAPGILLAEKTKVHTGALRENERNNQPQDEKQSSRIRVGGTALFKSLR
jgi:hypothetical protein